MTTDPSAARNGGSRRSMRDVIALSVLPAVWQGMEPGELAESVADVLWATLEVELVYLRMSLAPANRVTQIVRGSENAAAQAVCEALAGLLAAEDYSQRIQTGPLEIGALRIAHWSIHWRGGQMVMAVGRDDEAFPDPEEHVLLSVLANHAKAAFQHGSSAPAARARSELERQGLAHWQVRRVTAFMREHLEREIGLDELASVLKLSRYHFCTAFKQATGQTPYEWLTLERMRRARELLADPALSITQVAYAVGYKTPSAFSAAFRRTTGMTPSQVRRERPAR
jgi:AraC family transcriptional regulator